MLSFHFLDAAGTMNFLKNLSSKVVAFAFAEDLGL